MSSGGSPRIDPPSGSAPTSDPVRTTYNTLAGSQLERISALSDGIFAVAMTLLILDIHAPEAGDVHSEGELATALVALAPRVATWLMSLMTLGIFWLGQQAQLNQLKTADRNLSWLHFLFLAVMSALPFSTRLLASFFDFRLAFLVYYLNILLSGVTLYLAWRYAERADLTRESPPGAVSDAVRRRIVRGQSLYAIGLLAGLIQPVLGVVLIILIQVSYAFGLRWTDRA
jgi:uncharacterized membrane protein